MVWECQQMSDDVIQIKALAKNNTATWPNDFIKIWLNNYLVSEENEGWTDKVDSKLLLWRYKIVVKI